MKVIKYREFQRNFCLLTKGSTAYTVIDSKGKIVGYWTPYIEKAVGQAVESVKSDVGNEIVMSGAIIGVRHAEETQPAPELPSCFKCNEKIQESGYRGSAPNEDGEYVEMTICAICYKRFKPPAFRKFLVKNL